MPNFTLFPSPGWPEAQRLLAHDTQNSQNIQYKTGEIMPDAAMIKYFRMLFKTRNIWIDTYFI